MSVQALQEYTRISKYARFIPEENRRETWEEQIDRVFNMHEKTFGTKLDSFKEDFNFVKKMVLQKRILGSQRALQFGGDPIVKKNARMYNCSSSYCDRIDFFRETVYLLLCGCGVGFSVQYNHVNKLPNIAKRTLGDKTYLIPDSIEGWSDAAGVMMASYFVNPDSFSEYNGYNIIFDYSAIRPAGSPISSGSKAPGPDGLKLSLSKIEKLFNTILKTSTRLRTIDVYDIVMHLSDSVLSGGVRRSATICIFSPEDDDMINAKTGTWFRDNPQRGRSNNSALLVRNETSKETFSKLIKSVKECGEPGFVWADDREVLFNPCCEISFKNYDSDGKSGWGFCNLTEINGKKCKTKEDFILACKAASILGTLQASYTNFPYLTQTTKNIVERDALLGVSITGMMDNPDILFDESIQRDGATIVLQENVRIAAIIGINPCARATCIKPAGSTSCILGSSSGIHPHHARRYFRRVQANNRENTLAYFKKYNPSAVEKSVWSTNGTDDVITFLCEVPDGAKTKNDVTALKLLETVKLTQNNWIEYGTRDRQNMLRHNVSNTINVKPEEWDGVESYIYKNKKNFAGIAMLPMSGDKDYPQAPFTAVYTPIELVREYGDASVLASGLIVAANDAFEHNLWLACDAMLGIGEILDVDKLRDKITEDLKTNGIKWKIEGLSSDSPDKLLRSWLRCNVKNYYEKRKIRIRAERFAEKYFNSDLKKATYCLKDVQNWKLWIDLKRDYVEIDWTAYHEDEMSSKDFGGAGEACSGGTCDLMGLTDYIDKDRAKLKKDNDRITKDVIK